MVRKFFSSMVLFFYVVFFLLVVIYGNFVRGPYLYESPTIYLLFYGFLVFIGFYCVYLLLGKLTFLQNPKIFVPLLMVVSFFPRYVWVRLIPTVPMVDFLRFHNYALALIEGNYDAYLDIRRVFPHLSGYPLVLSYVYRIFGARVSVGLWFNVASSIISCLFIYLLGKRVFGERGGQMAGLIFALYPTEIMYNSLLASEHIFLTVFLLSLYLFISYGDSQLKTYRQYLKMLLVGVVLALAHVIRPVASLIIVPMVGYLLFFQEIKEPVFAFFKKRIALMVLVLLGFFAALAVLNWIYIDTIKVPLGKTGGGFNLYVGTDPERDGMWNPTAWQIIEEYNHDFDRVHQEAKKRAIERIKENPKDFIALAERKFAIQWGVDDYGYYWSMLEVYPPTAFSLWVKENRKGIRLLSQSYYMGIIILALLGSWISFKKRGPSQVGFFAMVVLIFAAAHVLIEVQSRYHHPVVPFFIFTGVAALKEGIFMPQRREKKIK